MAQIADSIYDLTFTSNTGEEVPLKQFEGKPLLIVNTASKCGFTPQYKGLQQIYDELGPDLVVIGFPCDQFAHQEPGDDEQIKEFCEINYGVTFPLSTKVDVNGSKTHPVFAFLKERTGGLLGSTIKWNFTKFLVAPDGTTVKRYAPKTDPEMVRIDAEESLKRS
jgi:glutathione peroxidase